MRRWAPPLALLLVLGLAPAALWAQGGSPQGVRILSHTTAGRGVDVGHANGLLVTIIGGDGRVAHVNASNQLQTSAAVTVDTISHITSVTHAVVVGRTGQAVAVNSSGQLEVNCTGCSAASTVVVTHTSSTTHVAGLVGLRSHDGARGAYISHANALYTSLVGTGGNVAAVTSGGLLEVNCTGCSAASTVVVSHVSSVTHVSGALMLRNQAGTLVTVTGTALDVNCTGCSAATTVVVSHVSSVSHVAGVGGFMAATQMGAWTIQAAHQAGTWNIGHISGALHVAGGTIAATQSGAWTVSANAGTGSLTVNQGGAWAVSAHQAGTWTVTANAGTGSQTVNQGGTWAAQAHQAGVWTTAHVTSVTHVAGTIQANRGSGQLTCHSTAAFAQSASGILVHAAGANRLFICGIVLVAAHANVVSFVEGTGVDCATGTTPVIGSSTAANGLAFNQNQGFASVSAFPWIATQTAGNNLCLLLNNAARVTGTVSYGGAP